MRVLTAICGALVFLFAALPLLLSWGKREIWGTLTTKSGQVLPLLRWENTIGSGGAADVLLKDASLQRTQGLLLRGSAGTWRFRDLKTGKTISLREGERFSVGKQTLTFHTSAENGGRGRKPSLLLALLGALSVTVSVFSLWYALSAVMETERITPSFLVLAGLLWLSLCATLLLGRRGFELECIGFFLSAIGLAVTASSAPEALPKETLTLCLGVFLYWLLGLSQREIGIVRVLRWLAAAAAVGLLIVNFLYGRSLLGAKNWLSLGGVSFQPSEVCKLAFVFVGAATLDRLYTHGNLFFFAAFSLFCVGMLALLGDFGTALVFFAAYLTMAFLRSGSLAHLTLAVAGAAGGAFLVIASRPYVSARFASFGHAWENPADGGYQQVRAMSAVASGGLFGLGAGKGWFHRVFAAETDLVFALVAEELGLAVALLCVLLLLALGLFAAKSTIRARSSFQVIAACGAAAILLAQTALNVFGSLDMLPFTGVTFPFVSRGGSSLMVSWGLLAFLKAADLRECASFAVKRRESVE